MRKVLIRTFMLASVGLALVLARLFFFAPRRATDGKTRLLVIRLDQTLGDSAMNSSLLRELRTGYPDAEITLVVHPRIHEMVKLCPHVDQILTYDWGSSLARSLISRHWMAARFCRDKLVGKTFNIALVPRFDEDHHAALLALFSGARRRIGYSSNVSERKSILNAGFNHLFTEVIAPDDRVKHEVERNLDVLRHLGLHIRNTELEMWSGPDDSAFADARLPRVDGQTCSYVGFGLSGGHSALKRWPVEKYVELARMIVAQAQAEARSVKFVLVGGNDDIALGKVFEAAHPDTINLIGVTTILQMHAVLQRVDLFIGNDSGSMHVAAAAGARVLGIFGSSCHHRFSAWGASCSSVSLELACGPCGQGHRIDRCATCIYPSPKCMDDLSPAFLIDQLATPQPVIRLSVKRASSIGRG